jgi:sialate O-acetylesterase
MPYSFLPAWPFSKVAPAAPTWHGRPARDFRRPEWHGRPAHEFRRWAHRTSDVLLPIFAPLAAGPTWHGRLARDFRRLAPNNVSRAFLQLTTALCLALAPLHAEVKLASPFTSHMVLQREAHVPVWGTADAGEQVTVEFGGQKKSATAAADGHWRLDLDALQTSAEGRAFIVRGSKSAAPLQLDDVLVGEVWLGTGQSNMAFTVSKAKASYAGLINEEQEIAAANYPQIRMFTAASVKSYEPKSNVGGAWLICSPQTVPGFSAVGYLFARDLQKELKVPVGILTVAFGASTAESWISREAMTADPQLKPLLDALDLSENFFRTKPSETMDKAPPRPKTINARPGAPSGPQRDPVQDQHFPTVLFNGMLNPVIPYAIRGAIWYQGESIVGGTPGINLYGHVQQAMLKDWRARWGEGDFPFYIVQLPGQQNVSNNPRIREEQATILALPHTGMAVIIDTGEAKNVHPHNKAPLGDRLTRLALANVYGRKIEYSGPVYKSMRVEKNVIKLSFTHLGSGLVAKGGPLKGFQIAGSDQKFVDAEATISGSQILVSSPAVTAPTAVRYAWDNFPEGLGCNLTNVAGLPASPFRTDHWDYPIAGVIEN